MTRRAGKSEDADINSDDDKTLWSVFLTNKLSKKTDKLPGDINALFHALRKSLETIGPEQKKWPNYGPVLGKPKGQDYRHCHLNKGQPTYVVVWKVIDRKKRIMEIRHVDTHEKTNYDRIR